MLSDTGHGGNPGNVWAEAQGHCEEAAVYGVSVAEVYQGCVDPDRVDPAIRSHAYLNPT